MKTILMIWLLLLLPLMAQDQPPLLRVKVKRAERDFIPDDKRAAVLAGVIANGNATFNLPPSQRKQACDLARAQKAERIEERLQRSMTRGFQLVNATYPIYDDDTTPQGAMCGCSPNSMGGCCIAKWWQKLLGMWIICTSNCCMLPSTSCGLPMQRS